MLIKLSQVLFNGQPLRLFCDLNADQAVSDLFNGQPLRLFCDLNADQAVSGFIQQSAFEAVL